MGNNNEEITVGKLKDLIKANKISTTETNIGNIAIFPISYGNNCSFWKEIDGETNISDEDFAKRFISYCCFWESEGDFEEGNEDVKNTKTPLKKINELEPKDFDKIVQIYLDYYNQIVVKSVDGVPKEKPKYKSNLEELRIKITRCEKRLQDIIAGSNIALGKSLHKFEKTIFGNRSSIFNGQTFAERIFKKNKGICSSILERTIENFSSRSMSSAFSGQALAESLSKENRKICNSILGRDRENIFSSQKMFSSFPIGKAVYQPINFGLGTALVSSQINLTSKIIASSNKAMMGDVIKNNHWAGLNKSVINLRKSYFNLLSTPAIPSLKKFECERILEETSKEMLVSEYSFGKLIKAPDIDNYDNDVIELQTPQNAPVVLLQEVAPELMIVYNGAHDAFQRKGTDYVRHVLTSIRELWSNLLRILAPEDRVLRWIDDSGKSVKKSGFFDDNNKVTRRAKLTYIYRELENSNFSNFICNDVSLLKEMFNTCNRLHSSEITISDLELQLIIMRSDSLLQSILIALPKNTT